MTYLMMLWGALALAEDPVPQENTEDSQLPAEAEIDSEAPLEDVGADEGQLSEEEYFASLADAELVDMVLARRQSGHYDDALRYLAVLQARDSNVDYWFEEALLLELKEQYADSAQRYKMILEIPELDPVFRRNVQFRYGIVLSDMGLDHEALVVFREAAGSKDLAEHEKLILEYARGVAYIYAGKTRKGVRKINKALLKQNSETGTWIEARARAALVYVLIEESESLTFEKPKKTAQRFQKRSELVGSAEEQIVVMINLGEPEYVLRSLILLSDAYFQVAAELRVALPPPELNREQQILFQRKQMERADFIDERGRSYCAKGLGYSDQMGFDGTARSALESCAESQ